MTENIYTNPVKRGDRNYQQVRYSCMNISIEQALAQAIGGKVNPHKFNKDNPETYYYDVYLGDIKFEVKRQKSDTKWFSYPAKGLTTFRNNCKKLDYLVTGKMIVMKEYFEVNFTFIIKSSNFFSYYKKSQYPNQHPYFNHHKAQNMGHCINILQMS